MKNTVAVKKSKSHIYAVRAAFLLFSASFAAAVAWAGKNALYISLLCGAIFIPVLLLELYCETWRISFGEKICRKFFFFERTYEWRELKEAKKYYSLSENGEILLLVFKGGRSLRFRLNDQNGGEAERLILKHCNIKHA